MTPSIKSLVMEKSNYICPLNIEPDDGMPEREIGAMHENVRLKPLITQLAEVIEKLEKALAFYADRYNYELVDEGRNYMPSYACYESNEETAIEEELGTRAKKELADLDALKLEMQK